METILFKHDIISVNLELDFVSVYQDNKLYDRFQFNDSTPELLRLVHSLNCLSDVNINSVCQLLMSVSDCDQ